jgi:hypothetical protein
LNIGVEAEFARLLHDVPSSGVPCPHQNGVRIERLGAVIRPRKSVSPNELRLFVGSAELFCRLF